MTPQRKSVLGIASNFRNNAGRLSVNESLTDFENYEKNSGLLGIPCD